LPQNIKSCRVLAVVMESENRKGEACRKKVLYLGKKGHVNHCLAEMLRREYDLSLMTYDDSICMLPGAVSKGGFSAVVTGSPPQNVEGNWCYGRSIEILRGIRNDFPDLPIIVYTGANDRMRNVLTFEDCGNDIIPRTGSDSGDADGVKCCVDYYVNKFPAEKARRAELMKIPPVIEKKEGRTFCSNATFNSMDNMLSLFARIAQEFGKIKGECGRTVVAQNESGMSGSLCAILDLITICSDKIILSVEGEDEKAERLIKMAYSGLTSVDSRNFTLYRWCNEE
jgi:hypothetical protein